MYPPQALAQFVGAGPIYDVGTGTMVSGAEDAEERMLMQALLQQGFTPDEVAGEVGRRRGLRRFGRALGGIVTLGGSEMMRGAVRHRARNVAQRMVPSAVPAAPATMGGTVAVAEAAATQAVNSAIQNALPFNPSGRMSGPFGFPFVTVNANSSAELKERADEPTQIHRFIISAIDTTGNVPPDQALEYISVTNIRIGAQSIFSNTAGMQASAFKQDSTGVMVGTRVVNSGQSVTINVTNDNAAVNFRVRAMGLGPT